MNYLAFLLETTTTTGDATQTLGTGMGATWIIMILMLVGMWWFTSRSQKKKDQEAQNMRDSLQVGDEVTTIGGIIGKVVSIKEETFVLETTKEKTHIRFLKGAIRSVDVRIADVTAAAEAKDAPEQPAEEAPKKFGFFKKNK
jgi:preprotein translocase subunit YajC